MMTSSAHLSARARSRRRAPISRVARAVGAAALVLCAVVLSGCFCRACSPFPSNSVRFHARAGKCHLNVSIKGPDGILTEGEVVPDWTSKEYDFKPGDKVSLSVFAVNCIREPTCKLTKGDQEFGEMRKGKTGNIICSGVVP